MVYLCVPPENSPFLGEAGLSRGTFTVGFCNRKGDVPPVTVLCDGAVGVGEGHKASSYRGKGEHNMP